MTSAGGGASFLKDDVEPYSRTQRKGSRMDAETLEAIELCRRILTSPIRREHPRWGEDFIAHRVAEHPEMEPEVKRLRRESEAPPRQV